MRYYSDYNKGISLIAEAIFCTTELNTKNNISKLFNFYNFDYTRPSQLISNRIYTCFNFWNVANSCLKYLYTVIDVFCDAITFDLIFVAHSKSILWLSKKQLTAFLSSVSETHCSTSDCSRSTSLSLFNDGDIFTSFWNKQFVYWKISLNG